MKKITFLKMMLLTIVMMGASIGANAQTLLAGWDFQTTSGGGTAVAVSPNSPTLYVANVGIGTMYLNGTNGSSTWLPASELNAFAGTSVNASNGLSTTTTSPACLALLGGTSNSANGKYITFKFSMTGLSNLTVSYATQKTSTGFSSQIWDYSTDGTNWTNAQTITSIPAAFATTTLNTITGLDNAATAYLRFSGTGASSASGNNRLDNIQLVTASTQTVATPGFSAIPGNVNSPQSVSLTCSTSGASIYYTLDGSVPNNTGNGTLFADGTPISVSTTTTVKAIAYKTSMITSPIATAIYTFPTPIANIAALRTASTSGFYQLNSKPLLTFQDAVGKVKFIQDASTAGSGIVIYDGTGKITTTYANGDKLQNIYCTLQMYNGMLELIPFSDPGPVYSSGNPVIPTTATLSNIATFAGQLVTVKNVAITGSGNFVASVSPTYTSYSINDGTAGVLRVAYTDLPYVGTAIPTVNQDITGVVNMYSVTEADLIPRTVLDFQTTPPAISVLESSVPNMSIDVPSRTLTVSGTNLTGDITLAISGTNAAQFDVNPKTLTQTSGAVSSTPVTISYTNGSASDAAVLTISSPGATSKTFNLAGGITTAISQVAQNLSVSVSDGSISFNSEAGKTVELYNAVGQKLLMKQTNAGLNSLTVSAKGLVVVKIGNQIAKVVL